MKLILILFSITAFVLLAFGIATAFIDLDSIGIEKSNHGYVSALFALSGVILFFVALMYQIREYKLQVIELKKSVDAQMKSSKELEEQKKILISQTNHSILFEMVNNFNFFKYDSTNHDKITHFTSEFFQGFSQSNHPFSLSNLPENLKNHANLSIKHTPYYYYAERLTQMSYNILYYIDEKIEIKNKKHFQAYFYVQLEDSEEVLIHLFNLIDAETPLYTNMNFNKEFVDKLISILITVYGSKILDGETINYDELCQKFNQLKQKNYST